MTASRQSLRELQEALLDHAILTDKGYAVGLGPTGGLAIDHHGHVRGIWHCRNTGLSWTAAGYNEASFHTSSVEEAVNYTINVIARG